MATGDYKSKVDPFQSRPAEDRLGSYDTDNRLNALDVDQRFTAMDHKRRVYGMDIDNALVNVPVLSVENFGHSSDWAGKPGSILSATNAKVLDRLGTVSSASVMDVVDEDGITITNVDATNNTIHFMHYTSTDTFGSFNDALLATTGLDNIRLNSTAIGSGTDGMDIWNKSILDVPLVVPVAIQKHGSVYRRTIGPFVVPIFNYASTQVEKVYNNAAVKVNAGISSKPLKVDAASSYESSIVELWLDGVSNEVFDWITWDMAWDIADWDEVVITTVKKTGSLNTPNTTTYTTTFSNVGGVIVRTGTVQIPITTARSLSAVAKYTKGATVVTENVYLAGGFETGNLTYLGFDINRPDISVPSGYISGAYGIWRFGIDISRGSHPSGVTLNCRVWTDSAGTGTGDFNIQSYKASVGGDSSVLNMQTYKAVTTNRLSATETVTMAGAAFTDRVNITIKKYISTDVVDVWLKPVNTSVAKVGDEEFFNGIFIGGLVKPKSFSDDLLSICNSVSSITSVSSIRETANFKICAVNTGSGIGIAVYDIDNSKIRYATLVNAEGQSLLVEDVGSVVSLINVITESDGYISFIVKFSSGNEYYVEYNTMKNTDGSKLFNDSADQAGKEIWSNNSWCHCYDLNRYKSSVTMDGSNAFCNIGDKKYISTISCNGDIALGSVGLGSCRLLNGHSSVYSVNDLMQRTIGVINDTVKFAMPVVKIMYPFRYPAITVNMTTDIDPSSSTPTARDAVTRMGGIGTNIPIAVHSAVIVSTPAIDTSTREYTILPSTVGSVTGIDEDRLSRPLTMNSIIGRTSVVVGDNLYEPSSFKLIRKNDKPLLPENGSLRIYGGLVIVSNDKTSSIYNQSELGFNYLTSLSDKIISNIVNVSGSLIFVGSKAIYSFINGGVRKLLQLSSDQAQIKSINGSDFTVVSLKTSGFTTSSGISLYQIEQDSSLSQIDLASSVETVFNLIDSHNINYEDVSMFDSSYAAKQVATTSSMGKIVLVSRNISLLGNGRYSFMCDYIMVTGFIQTEAGSTYPTGESNWVDLRLTGRTETTVMTRKKFSMTNGVAERLLFPIGKELREFQFVLEAFPAVKITAIELVGKFANGF